VKTCGQCAWFKQFDHSKALVDMGLKERARLGRCEAPIRIPSQCYSCFRCDVVINGTVYNCSQCGRPGKAMEYAFMQTSKPACKSFATFRGSVAVPDVDARSPAGGS
jgi:hypothetical protein